MAGCDPRTFSNIDRAGFDCLQGKLAEAGYNLSGTSGNIKGPMGIAIDYNYDENAQTLFVHVKDKNFLVPCSRIMAELEKAITNCTGQANV